MTPADITQKLRALASQPSAFRTLDARNQISPPADHKERRAIRENLPADLQPLFDQACHAADKCGRASV